MRVSRWPRTGEEAASCTCQPPRAGPHRGSSSLNGVLMTLVLRWMPCEATGGGMPSIWARHVLQTTLVSTCGVHHMQPRCSEVHDYAHACALLCCEAARAGAHST